MKTKYRRSAVARFSLGRTALKMEDRVVQERVKTNALITGATTRCFTASDSSSAHGASSIQRLAVRRHGRE